MNHKPVLVDTSGWICFFARKGFRQIKKAIGSLLDENRVAVVGPVVVELIQGCRDEQTKAEVERALQGLRWLSVQDRHWHLSAQLAFNLRRRGGHGFGDRCPHRPHRHRLQLPAPSSGSGLQFHGQILPGT